MEDFIKRLIEEKKQLDHKINLLKLFLCGDKIKELDDYHQFCLRKQCDFMNGYSGMLEERLRLIKKGSVINVEK